MEATKERKTDQADHQGATHEESPLLARPKKGHHINPNPITHWENRTQPLPVTDPGPGRCAVQMWAWFADASPCGSNLPIAA